MNKHRIIYYYQTFNGLKDILKSDTDVTHIHVSSIHFGNNLDNSPYIHLNDYDPDNKIFDNVWKELEEASKLNIEIKLMIGGAGGAYYKLFRDFDTYYPMLKSTIEKYNFISGVDLDVEEYVSIDNIKMLINKISEDFSENFSISMAPIQSSLQQDDPGLGGFVYKELYNSLEGKKISYFNTQFYFDYSYESFKQIIDNGYPQEKIVLGSISSQDIDEYIEETKKIKENFHNFGGVFNWEYFDAPKNWDKKMGNILNSDYDLKKHMYNYLNTGDLILFSEDYGFVANLIKWYTNSKWTHVGIVLKNPTYISPDLKGYYLLECGYNDFKNIDGNYYYGVQIVDLEKKITSYDGLVCYKKLKKHLDKNILENTLKNIYNTVKNKPYDVNLYDFLCLNMKIQKNINYDNFIFDYINNFFFNHKKTDKFICSSLVAYIFVELGLLPSNVNWSECEPVTFSDDNSYDKYLINFLDNQVIIKNH